MHLWDLKDVLSTNRIEDEVWYAIDDLDGMKVQGKHIKDRDFFPTIEAHIRWRMENHTLVARYYPNMYDRKVYHFDPAAPAYEISPEFSGIREVAKELQLPQNNDVRYRVRIFTGNSFCLGGKRVPDSFRQYTVETLGVKIKPLSPPMAETMGMHLPSALDYEYIPAHFKEIDSYLTVVWRLRVFACPIEELPFSLSAPISPMRPDGLYFEHRWHPQRSISETFVNVEKVRTDNPGLFDRFKTDTFFLLGDRPRKGRPPNSGVFPDKEEFLKRCNEALYQCGREEMSTEELAEILGISPITCFKYAKQYGLIPSPGDQDT